MRLAIVLRSVGRAAARTDVVVDPARRALAVVLSECRMFGVLIGLIRPGA
jgi:hypothetical protein